MNKAVDRQFVIWRDRAEAAEAEVERLRAIPRDIQVADSMIRELRAEVERLTLVLTPMADEIERLEAEIERLRAEVERLRKDNLHWEHQNGLLEDKVERLRAALQRIDSINDNPAYFRFNPMIEEVLRAALEPKP